MRKKGANREQVIARLAANQHGVVAAAQLRDAGIPDYSVTRRAQAGRLHRLHRGVYAVGHTKLTFDGRCIAAALAVGEVAVVSHRSAAAIWAMLPPHSGPIDVTVPGDGGRRKRHGITVHRSSTLVAGVSTRRNGIGVTKPARTLRDLHRTVPQSAFRRAIRRSLDLRLISDADLEGDADLTRSELERIFLNLCRRHRDAQLQRLGFRVLRFTYRQLTRERSAVVAALHALLSQRSLTPNL